MEITKEQILEKIETGFKGFNLEVKKIISQNNHWALHIASDKFKGLNRVQQHRLVYEMLGKEVGVQMHAVQLKTEEL